LKLGLVIYSDDSEKASKAIKIIENIVKEIEIGETYEGTVTKLMAFGAFVNIGRWKRRITSYF
jgi:polyribonucleotide nucleotidyltransferase